MSLRITTLHASNWMAIEELELPIAEGGAIIEGGNARGKTSVLKAILAALTARGVDPDAIRIGEEKAELRVDLGHYSVRRVIQRNMKGKGRLEVRREDGTEVRAPQSFLDDLLGPAVDPLDLYLAKPSERRAKILAAIPAKVTIEQLRAWAPDVDEKTNTEGHGLEVVDRVRELYYERRHTRNAVARKAKEDAERAAADVEAKRKLLPSDEIPATDAVREHLDAARAEVASIESRNREAERAEKETAEARAQIEDLRTKARALAADAFEIPKVEMDAAWVQCEAMRDLVERLERQLAKAREDRAAADSHWRDLSRRQDAARDARERAASMESQANVLERTIARVAAQPVSQSDIDAAFDRLAEAERMHAAAEQRDRVLAEQARADRLAEVAAAEQAEANRLDTIVRTLRDDAPRALLAASGIEGLTLEGDDVAMNGVRLGSLSGMEALRFATRIAKLAGRDAKLKLLIVDGMERLDREQREAFEVMATEDGFQLLGSYVTGGDITVKAVRRAEGEVSR